MSHQPHPGPPRAPKAGGGWREGCASAHRSSRVWGPEWGLVGPPCPLPPSSPSLLSPSFRPALPVSYLQAELAFEGEAACRAFLEPLGLAYTGPDNTSIDCRLSLAQLPSF